jgi:ATP-dependent helicase HepA
MRYGDPFVAGITEVTQADDRGRTFAMWRYLPGYRANLVADLHFRFDFVVEADIAAAVSVLKARGVGGGASTAAARRRADMALPPFFKTVWLNTELLPICDQDKLDALERPYTPDGVGAAAHDLNLNAQRWRRLSRLDIPELENWPALCAEARKRAEAILQARYDLTERLERADRRAAQVEHGRLGQLRARARVEASSAGDPVADLQLEEALSAALRSGIRSPRIRVDSIGAVFVSGDRGATDAVNGGAT